MKKRFYDVDPKERRRMLNDFCKMVAGIKNEKDAEKFLRDLLTPSEIVMIIHRIEIAKMLITGFGYEDIRKKLKVGTNTVSAVNQWLYSGFGGYMNGFKEAENNVERRKTLPKNEWEAIKKKYPIHFLLFNLIDEVKKRKKS